MPWVFVFLTAGSCVCFFVFVADVDTFQQIDAPRASMVAARADVVKREVITTQSEVCMLSKSL